MTCENIRELLHDFVEGTLPEPKARALREHVATCKACRERHEEILALDRAIAGVKRITAPPAVVERTKAAIRTQAQKALFWRAWGQRAAVAAAVALAVIAVTWQPVRPAASPAWMESVRTTVQAAGRGFAHGIEDVLAARGISTAQLGFLFKAALCCVAAAIVTLAGIEELSEKRLRRRFHITS